MKNSLTSRSSLPKTSLVKVQNSQQPDTQSRIESTSVPLDPLRQNQPQARLQTGLKPSARQRWLDDIRQDNINDVLDKKRELIDYATQCALNGNPLSKRDITRIKVANKAIQLTQAHIRYSGNKANSIINTQGISPVAIQVVREFADRANLENCKAIKALANKIKSKEISAQQATNIKKQLQTDILSNKAAYAHVANTGNCGEMANHTAQGLAIYLPSGEKASIVGSKKVDHAWVVQTPVQGTDDSPLVAESYLTGGAIRQADARAVHQRETETYDTYSKEDGVRLRHAINSKIHRIKTQIQNNGFTQEQEIHIAVHQRIHNSGLGNLAGSGIFNEGKSTSPEFREGARIAVKTATKLEGPREESKALVEVSLEKNAKKGVLSKKSKAAVNYVNKMILDLASELGVPSGALAARVAGVIFKTALTPEPGAIPPTAADASLNRRL